MSDPDPIETAWRIHAALTDWTGKVDTKASFALAIESAVIAGVITLRGDGRIFHDLAGWETATFWAGVVLLAGAVLSAVWVVRPRLRGRKLAAEGNDNFIFFGHLKDWKPDRLEDALKHTDLLPVLSRQVVAMSKIAWVKHRCVQWSMNLSVFGVAALASSAAISG